ncbi:MAG: hypothetical protein IT462_04425 [Planctomycetes bacterium]|nr:hypothetical protein [Planctomycetota bacterium]
MSGLLDAFGFAKGFFDNGYSAAKWLGAELSGDDDDAVLRSWIGDGKPILPANLRQAVEAIVRTLLSAGRAMEYGTPMEWRRLEDQIFDLMERKVARERIHELSISIQDDKRKWKGLVVAFSSLIRSSSASKLGPAVIGLCHQLITTGQTPTGEAKEFMLAIVDRFNWSMPATPGSSNSKNVRLPKKRARPAD